MYRWLVNSLSYRLVPFMCLFLWITVVRLTFIIRTQSAFVIVANWLCSFAVWRVVAVYTQAIRQLNLLCWLFSQVVFRCQAVPSISCVCPLLLGDFACSSRSRSGKCGNFEFLSDVYSQLLLPVLDIHYTKFKTRCCALKIIMISCCI